MRLSLAALGCILVAGLFVAAPNAHAQITIDVPPPDSDAPITGKPYEADKVTHTRRVLADGTITTRDIQVREARDSKGRFVEEAQTSIQLHANGPETSFVFVVVRDPVAGVSLTWNSLSKSATQVRIVSAAMRALSAEASGKPMPEPPHKPELLGQRMIDGRMTTGRLTEKPVPAGAIGNATATVNKHEWWTDEDLHLVVLDISSNPQHGEQTTELQSVKLVEPDPARFHPPEGYTIRQMGPPGLHEALAEGAPAPPQPLDLVHAPSLSREDALLKLSSSEQSERSVGAAVLVKEAQASDSADEKNDIAYRLARADIGLIEAQQLAEAAVQQAESTTSADHAGNINAEDFNREITLSHYWHTLGYIDFRRGDAELAKQYIERAWELDPRAYYGAHLGRLFEDAGDTTKALRIYREALNVPGSDDEKRSLQRRIQTLAGTSAPSANVFGQTLDGVTQAADGSAFFDLVYAAGSATPRVLFVNGTDALKPLISEVAKTGGETFALPDKGREVIVRRVEITCKAAAGPPCQFQPLSIQQARDNLRR